MRTKIEIRQRPWHIHVPSNEHLKVEAYLRNPKYNLEHLINIGELNYTNYKFKYTSCSLNMYTKCSMI